MDGVIEKTVFDILPGREEAFLAFLAESRAFVEGLPGCRSFAYGRGVEDPAKVIFIVGWDSVAAHRTAAAGADFTAFGRTLFGFVTRPAIPSHYAMAPAR